MYNSEKWQQIICYKSKYTYKTEKQIKHEHVTDANNFVIELN